MEHHSKNEIDKLAFDILHKSKSLDVYPTPVDQIVNYCELKLQDEGGFHNIPNNYIPRSVDAFKRMLSKVVGIFDRSEKNIFIDPSLPEVKQRFVKLHEAGHGAIPWQKDVEYFDDKNTLGTEVKDIFEKEANLFASASLFQLHRFEDEMLKLPLEIGSPMALAKKFGGSNHAAMRRYAEYSNKRCALLVLEKKERGCLHFRNCFESKKFADEFGHLSWPEKLDDAFPFIKEYNFNKRLHTKGSISLLTFNGLEEFSYHYFNNSYNLFILLMPNGEKNKSKTKIHIISKDSF